MIRVDVNQTRLTKGQKIPERDLRRALAAVERALRSRKNGTISLAFVGSGEMRRLNTTYRGKRKVTDVLSFTLDDRDQEDGALGEILICYPVAKRQARELDHSPREEVLFLFVHGLLHVFGYDHERPKDAKRMFLLQTRILQSLDVDPRL